MPKKKATIPLTPDEGMPMDMMGPEPDQMPPGVPRGSDDASKQRCIELKDVFDRYKKGKEQLDKRIIENDRWYRNLQWDVLREKSGKAADPAMPDPTSAFLWNTIANRHGDLMDGYPQAVMTEREQSDEQAAKESEKVVRVGLERNRYAKTYSDCAWYKVKAGTSAKGVFWDQSLEGGLGDWTVKKIDILRLFWEPGITDIQDSEYVFVTTLMNTKAVKRMYPALSEKIDEDAKGLSFETYASTDTPDYTGKTMVYDCYYKEYDETGRPSLHMDKFTGSVMLDSTKWKNQPLYAHGRYPFVLDPMFPEENSPCGFGIVDVLKSPQTYIDKLDQILTLNALTSGINRYVVKKGVFPVEDLMDLSKHVIESKGNVKEGEDYAVLSTLPLPASVVQHRLNKIDELKQVSGSNDFNRGSAGSGVTAASAILALQEAGNKLARAMLAGTYQAFQDEVYLIMELIAEKYDDARKYRITNEETGAVEYLEFNAASLRPQPITTGNPAVDGLGNTRKPIIDIAVHAEKHSPYQQLAMNEMAKEMFTVGMFNPEMAPAALVALKMMGFSGKDKIEKMIRTNFETYMQQAVGGQQSQALIETIQKMNEMIIQMGGQDMLAGTDLGNSLMASQQGGVPQPGQQSPGGPAPMPAGKAAK